MADLIERAAGLEAKHYPDNVSYYGKVFTRDAVLSDKHKFNARWPQRRYVMDSATIQCLPSAGSTICDAATQGRWWVSNGQKVGSGTMTGSGGSISSRRYCWRRALPPVILPRYRRRSSLRATRGTSEVPQIADGSATALLTGNE